MNRKEPNSPTLSCEKLRVRCERNLEQSIDFTLEPGQVLGVVGPGRSGKSALLATFAGLLEPAAGSVSVCGWPPGSVTQSLVGYVSRNPGVEEEFSCEEYLYFFAEAFEVAPHFRPYLVREALKTVRLEGYQDKLVGSLSYGLRRYLGVARALVHDPELLIMDDCLSLLERSERATLVEILADVRNQGRSLVLGAESLSELSGICSHICVLVSEKVLACGSVRDLNLRLSNFRMMQVQFEAGFRTAVRILEREEKVFHLAVSTRTGSLVRFLFEGDQDDFNGLLKQLQGAGCSIVSFAEDQRFLGKSR